MRIFYRRKVLIKKSSNCPVKWDKQVIEKCFRPVTCQVKVLGVSMQIHMHRLVQQPDKMSMPTPAKEGIQQSKVTVLKLQ